MEKDKIEAGEKESNPVNSGEKSIRVAQIFHLLGTDPQKNIGLILDQILSIIGGLFSLYLRGDNRQGKPVIRAGSNLPWDMENTLSPGGHLFTDPLFAEPLFASHGIIPGPYCILPPKKVMSDPLGKKLGVKTCLGTPVFHKERVMGTLWLTDTQTRSFSPDEIHYIQTLAAALGLEEERLRVTALRDISELKQVQKSLLEEKERYKVLIDNVNDAIYIAQDGHIKFANPKTIALSGYTPEDLSKIPFIELVHPDDREDIRRNHQKRLNKESTPSTYAFRVVTKQQDTLWVQLNAVRIIWNKKPAILGCIRDISRIKNLEEKLKQSEKMELIGTMAGEVAHDLNNILSGLVSYPELLLIQLEKGSPLVEPISFIHDTGLKAAEIVQDLLTLTRRGIHQASVFNLNQVIHGYYNSSAHHRLERNFPEIYFKISLEPYPLNLTGSESHIAKVVMNLVMNAAEAVQAGGQVSIETFNRYVDIGKGDEIPEGEYVVLRVSDTGEGVSPGDIKRIFEPFYTKKQMGRSGSGLGLSVVWNVVKDHQGYIKIASEKENGTSFEITFPGTRDKMENISDDFQIEAFKGDNKTILVIDDVKGQRKIAQGCLKMLGYTCFAVSSGEKAISFLKKHPMDLLVLDMKMEPGIDGLQTYKEALKINPKQKAVIASGFSETQRIIEAKQLGVGQYIKKPYTLQKFAIAIKKELTRNN